MKLLTWTATLIVALTFCAHSHADSAQDILEKAWDMQVRRWGGLDSYLVEQSVMGHRSQQYFVRTTVADANGKGRTMFLPSAGLRNGCAMPISDSPSSDSRDGSDDAARHMSWFINNAKLVGEEPVGDQRALQFRADGLEEKQAMQGREVTMTAMSMWLSESDYVPLKVRMEGVATIEGKARPVVIDTVNSDFRTVAGSQLNEPFRRVIGISGVMESIDPRQIAKAQEQMAEFEKEMAKMPESQRAMMKKMMGPRLEAMRKMSQTGSLETEIVVDSITPNPEVSGKRVVACN